MLGRSKLPPLVLVGLCVCVFLCAAYLIFYGTTIYRTSYGFFPSSISVPVGTTVTFKNLSSGFSWPASDQHPYHTLYKEFDAKEVLEPGDSWSFVFDRQGIWNYHDHVSARLIGKVIVYGEDGDTTFECPEDAQTACWAAEVDEVLRTEGVAAAFRVLERIYNVHPGFASQCHGFAHDVGLKSYIYFGKDAELPPETTYCNVGFYHGFLESMISEVKDLSEVDAFCQLVGDTLGTEFPIVQSQCVHGIGHGLIEHYLRTRPELISAPKELFGEVFKVCAGLEINEQFDDELRCVSGAFDSYKSFVMMRKTFDGSDLDPSYLSFCDEFTQDTHVRACYWQMARLFARPEYIDPFLQEIAETGSSSRYYYDELLSPEKQAEHLGIVTRAWALFIGKKTAYDHPAEVIVKACRQVPQAVAPDCLFGLVEGTFFSSPARREYERVTMLCTDTALTEVEIEACYNVFQTYLFETYATSEAVKQCTYVPQMYRTPEYCGLQRE